MAQNNEVLTADNMRKVVEEEGLEARNLLNWNVIVSDKSSLDVPKTTKKPPTSPRPQSASPKPPTMTTTKDAEPHVRSSKRCSSLGRHKARLRSSSVGRNPDKCVRARYWAFLFENLYRAVDEIYQTCEVDESIVESKEAIMMLENYCKEFQALIQWLTISKNYEVTPPRNRPTSLAWEVRKSLPTKGLLRNIFLDKLGVSSETRRKLDLQGHIQSTENQTDTARQESHTYNSLPRNSLSTSSSVAKYENSISGLNETFNLSNGDQTSDLSSDTINGDQTTNPLQDAIKDGDEMCNLSSVTIVAEETSNLSDGTVTNDSMTNHSDVTIIGNESYNHSNVVVIGAESFNLSNGTIISDETVNVDNGTIVSDETVNGAIVGDKTCNLSDSTAIDGELCNFSNGTIVCAETTNLDKTANLLNGAKISDETNDLLCGSNMGDEKGITLNTSTISDEMKLLNGTIIGDKSNNIAINASNVIPADKVESLCVHSHDDSTKKKFSVEFLGRDERDDFEANAESKSTEVEVAKTIVKLAVDPNESIQKTIPLNLDPGTAVKPALAQTEKNFPEHQDNAPMVDGTRSKLPNHRISVASQTDTQVVKSAAPKQLTDVSNSTPHPVKPHQLSPFAKPWKPTGIKIVPTKPTISLRPVKTTPQPNLSLKTKTPADTKSQLLTEKLSPRTTAIRCSGSLQSSARVAKVNSQRPATQHSAVDSKVKSPLMQQSVVDSKGKSPLTQHSIVDSKVKSPLTQHSVVDSKVKSSATQHSVIDSKGKPPVTHHSVVDSKWKSPLTHHSIGDPKVKSPLTQSNVVDSKGKSRMPDHSFNKNAAKIKAASSSTSLDSSLSVKSKKLDAEGHLGNTDSDGWETVRGRTRCKNSPAKKILSSNGAYDAAKIHQSKVGGFPYTCTSNLQKKPVKPSQTASKTSSKSNETPNAKPTDSKTGSKKNLKDNVKPEASKKVSTLLKRNEITSKGLESTTKTVVDRHLSSEKSKTKNPDLRKSYSCSSFETKKKSEMKVAGSDTKVRPTIPGNVRPKDKDSTMQSIEDSGDSTLKEGECAVLERHGDETIIEKSPICSPRTDEMLTLTNSSDDSDGLISQDEEGMNDTETIEMYEKMIREEAQEHISELGLSWGDQMDLLDMELRTPGRALQMHEKLSSPFRKRTLAETIRRHEEKQLKAQEQRERFLEEKAQRFKDIQKKVEEMKALNERKQEQQRISLEQRLQRAEEKRKKELEKIIRKAHDEEEKVNEIAFINSLEAQNKRHDLISKEKDHEARLQDIQGERQRKLEEKAAKEAAAEERRKVLEAERQARLLEMQEKRKQRDLKIEQQLIEKEKERQEMAHQKARERELRLSALNAAHQATMEELQKKIQLKQEESARRHEENIEQIRQKAFELSVRRYSSNNDDAPQLVPYETKKICTICNVFIASEVYLLSHLRGKKHQEMIALQHPGQNPSTEELELYNLKHIVNASTDQIDPNIALDKERLKALKKRCKKLRQRMANRGVEYEKENSLNGDHVESKQKQKMLRLISEIKKFTSEPVPYDSTVILSMERTYTELGKLLRKCGPEDKVDFRDLGGVNAVMDLLLKITTPLSNNNTLVPMRVIAQASRVTLMAFYNCYENSIHILMTNKIGLVLDVLVNKLKVLIPDNFDKLVNHSSVGLPPIDEVAGELMYFLSIVLDYLTKKKVNDPRFWDTVLKELKNNQEEEFRSRINDIVSYTVSIGIVDRLSQYFNSVRSTIDSESDVGTFLLHSMSLLVAVVKLSSESYTKVFDKKKAEDTTQLLATLKMTDLVGSVSLLYCILLHDGLPPLDEKPPQQLPEHTVLLTLGALRMINYSAVLNLHVVQNMLGSEGLSLQLRHILNYLLWYCKHQESPDLLHETILLIGFFTALNPDNQLIVHAGQEPSVLKQLSTLPFQYFSNDKLCEILFPTLISCCFHNDCNKSVLGKEMSIQLLSNYVEAYLLDLYNSAATKTDANIRWKLLSRFPKCKWTAVKTYFCS